jgi:CheY-like chemotaxis protein
MFMQADTSVGRAVQSGLGVGLALSRRLIQRHGGSIEAFSAGTGRGSRFTVRLPVVSKLDPAESVPIEHGDMRPLPQRILIVDDNHDFATSLAMILRDLGHDVRVEHDGMAALHAADVFQPAIALLDIGMPGMSGYDLARALRSHIRTRGIVLVAITGWGQEADKLRTHEAGFDHHLVKPLEPAALPRLLAQLAVRRSTARR